MGRLVAVILQKPEIGIDSRLHFDQRMLHGRKLQVEGIGFDAQVEPVEEFGGDQFGIVSSGNSIGVERVVFEF